MLQTSDTHSELNHYMESDEQLIWTGKPKSGIIFRPIDIVLIPFSLIWSGFAVFWFIVVARFSVFGALFALPFILVGLILVFGRFLFDSKRRKNTFYGLTNKRLILKTGIFSSKIRSIDFASMTNLEMVEKADGSGTISWGINQLFFSTYSGMNGLKGLKTPPIVEMIPDVKILFNKLRQLQSTQNSDSI